MKRIALAMIWMDDRLLLQLRDFDASIADPGMWGLFGGHILDAETPGEALRRELIEEIGWAPVSPSPLGTFVSGDRLMVGFKDHWPSADGRLMLGEGQEYGWFTLDDMRHGSVRSEKWEERFPLTPITLEALRLWSRI